MNANHKPEKGRRNLLEMYNSLETESVKVNTIIIESETQKEHNFEMKDIGKPDRNQELITSVTIPKKRACLPHEVIQVPIESCTFPIVIIYDTGSEVTL